MSLRSIDFFNLFKQARNPHEREILLELAVAYHVDRGSFEDAAWFRERLKQLRKEMDVQLNSLGSDVLQEVSVLEKVNNPKNLHKQTAEVAVK
jgi:hypothetical protein